MQAINGTSAQRHGIRQRNNASNAKVAISGKATSNKLCWNTELKDYASETKKVIVINRIKTLHKTAEALGIQQAEIFKRN
tara:strand:+ start:536 stop:775 length:240 start_codon:yes stop_codon:yes gene_type:complete